MTEYRTVIHAEDTETACQYIVKGEYTFPCERLAHFLLVGAAEYIDARHWLLDPKCVGNMLRYEEISSYDIDFDQGEVVYEMKRVRSNIFYYLRISETYPWLVKVHVFPPSGDKETYLNYWRGSSARFINHYIPRDDPRVPVVTKDRALQTQLNIRQSIVSSLERQAPVRDLRTAASGLDLYSPLLEEAEELTEQGKFEAIRQRVIPKMRSDISEASENADSRTKYWKIYSPAG